MQSWRAGPLAKRQHERAFSEYHRQHGEWRTAVVSTRSLPRSQLTAQINLDLLYLVSELTGDKMYSDIATCQAWKSINTFIRPDYTTNHVIDFNRDGTVKRARTHQGIDRWSDEKRR